MLISHNFLLVSAQKFILTLSMYKDLQYPFISELLKLLISLQLMHGSIPFNVFAPIFPFFLVLSKVMQVMFSYDAALQIAERKKLVSSIKNSIIDPEGSEQPYMESKVTISSPDAAAKTEGNDISLDHKLEFLSTSTVHSPRRGE